jgi:serine/threonine-protein kinase
MVSRAVRMPSVPLDALIELSELDGLVMENPRATFRAQSGSTLIGAGPLCAPDRTVGVAMAINAGDVLAGKYEVLSLIGRGTASFVMSARHRGFDSEVALKFFDPELVDHREAARRFALECKNALRLRSDAIVRVFELEQLPNGQPFLVMERLVGRDLRTALAEAGRFSLARSATLALEACEALATAHAVGISHRKLKPEKLFLTHAAGREQLKLLDLGSSHEQHESSHRVPTVNTGGVPLYMSPEQMRGAAAIDARSDIWSLGCVLFEMLAGTPLFLHGSLAQACVAVLERPTPSLRALRAEVPAALEEAVLRCLQKEPAQRFEHVVELAWALVPFASADAEVHAARCAHIFEEHGLLARRAPRVTAAQLDQHAAAVDAAAPANMRTWPSAFGPALLPRSGPVEDTLRTEASRSLLRVKLRRAIANTRLASRSTWLSTLAVGLFVLGCYLALHPSPHAQRRLAARAAAARLEARTPTREASSEAARSAPATPAWSKPSSSVPGPDL